MADPPVKTAAEAARSGKLVCLMIGNIHAGEVCGKEALPMLLREVFAGPHPPLLKDVILAVAPIYNADGNERVSKTNRPGQVGPEEGMGQRANARGLDLNRDFIKLEAPETRGLVRFLNEWNPHLFIDTHTTNGSHHRYTITYEGPKNPAGDPRIVGFMRQTFFPEVSAAFEKRTGIEVVLLRELQPRPHAVDDLSGRGAVRHDLRGSEEPAVGPLRGVFLRPVQDAGAGHSRLRARLPANGREPQGRDRQAAGPGAAGGRREPASRPRARARCLVPIRSRAKAAQEPGDGPRFCRARGERPPRQDRHAQGLHAPSS